MCGRVARNYDGEELVAEFDLEEFSYTRLRPLIEQVPLFNVAPSQNVPVVVQEGEGRVIRLIRWGLIPSWSKDGEPGQMSTINARDDKILESKLYAPCFKSRRCLVPVSGFYEWQGAKPPKTPHYIYMKDAPIFALAGVWDFWKPKAIKGANEPSTVKEPFFSISIVTTEPNELMKPIHNRMPVIVARANYGAWLDPENHDVDRLRGLLKPFPAERMAEHIVGRIVGSPKNDTAECIAPIA